MEKIGQSLGMDATLSHRFHQGAPRFLMMTAVGEAAVPEKGVKFQKSPFQVAELKTA